MTDSAMAPSFTLTNLVTHSNQPSGISISFASFGGGANTNGALSPDSALGPLAISNATMDSFFAPIGGTAITTLSGLVPTGQYRLICFGSRDASDTRVTRYRAQGLNTVTGFVQTSGAGIGVPPRPGANYNQAAVLSNVQPTVSGQITLFVNGESNTFGYLGALMIERTDNSPPPPSNQPPSASSVVWVGPPVAGRTIVVHYAFSDPDGDAEDGSQIFWQIDVPPFTNSFIFAAGTNRMWTVPNGTGAFIRAIVEPRAATGATPGAWAYSDWRGPIAPSNATAVFHIGNSFTRWGHVALQLQNLAADAGRPHAYGEHLRDGMGLSFHWTNGLLIGDRTRGTPSRLELAAGGWNWVVLQPMSREWLPENLPAFREFALRFAGLAHSNGTRVALYQYWNYLNEGPAEQDAIQAAFEDVRAHLASNGIPAVIIPVGSAFSNAVARIAGLNRADFYQDNIHPSDIGYYLSALTHHATIYRRSPVGLTNGAISADHALDDPITISNALALALQEVAWDSARFYPASGVTRGRYDEWAASANVPGTRDPWDDPFADFVPNWARWAMGIAPASNASLAALPAIRMTNAVPEITYGLSDDAFDAGLRFQDQWSDNLITWSATSPAIAWASVSNQWRVIRLLDSEPRLFHRVLFTYP